MPDLTPHIPDMMNFHRMFSEAIEQLHPEYHPPQRNPFALDGLGKQAKAEKALGGE